MVKPVCLIIGLVLSILGGLGFASPGIFGMHLSPWHNVIHVAAGMLALYFGWDRTSEAARAFCMVFGLVYGLLGVAGFLFGASADYLLTVVPDQLVFGAADHLLHLILGGVALAAGVRRQPVAAWREI